MIQRSEGKYFPNSDGGEASGTTMDFIGLTAGRYYELQKKNNEIIVTVSTSPGKLVIVKESLIEEINKK